MRSMRDRPAGTPVVAVDSDGYTLSVRLMTDGAAAGLGDGLAGGAGGLEPGGLGLFDFPHGRFERKSRLT